MAETLKRVALTPGDWRREGVRRFGPDERLWKFKCPACGHVASYQEYMDAGAPENVVAFSCIGRWLDGEVREAFGDPGTPGPCNYAGGGLFGLNPVSIAGRADPIFAFADELEVGDG